MEIEKIGYSIFMIIVSKGMSLRFWGWATKRKKNAFSGNSEQEYYEKNLTKTKIENKVAE